MHSVVVTNKICTDRSGNKSDRGFRRRNRREGVAKKRAETEKKVHFQISC